VLAATFDIASVNRRLVKIHSAKQEVHKVHKALNIYAPDEQEIFFFSDPNHLIKTRKYWASSTRHL